VVPVTRTDPPESIDNGAVLQALAEPHRTQLVRLLVDRQLCVRDLVTETGMAQPLVSHHLRVLREAGLVESTVCSNLTVYRLRADTLTLLARRLADMALRAAVTSETKPC
jgi:ArsR family transcriptional regulator